MYDCLVINEVVGTVSLSDGDLRIGPCRSQQLGQRQEAGTGRAGPGTREIIGEGPGPKVCPVHRVAPGDAARSEQGIAAICSKK
jgi:hypothetical protein